MLWSIPSSQSCFYIFDNLFSFWFLSTTNFWKCFNDHQFSLRTHRRRFSSFLFQSIQLNLAELVCSASHQSLTKFWLALPLVAWGLVFVKLSVRSYYNYKL